MQHKKEGSDSYLLTHDCWQGRHQFTCFCHHSLPAGGFNRAVDNNVGPLSCLHSLWPKQVAMQVLSYLRLEVRPHHPPIQGLWHLKLPSWKEEKFIDDVYIMVLSTHNIIKIP